MMGLAMRAASIRGISLSGYVVPTKKGAPEMSEALEKAAEERWLPIARNPAYQVSDLGRIRNAATGQLRAAFPNRVRGYKQVGFRGSDGRVVSVKVHRLVAEAFVPNPGGKPQINHINADIHDNRAINLEWVTQQENQDHAHSVGRYHAATNARRWRKLTPAIVDEARRRHDSGESWTSIAADYGITSVGLSKAINGNDQRGVTKGMARTKITAEVAGRIKGLFASGLSQSEIARRVGTTPAIVNRIVRGIRWKSAPMISHDAQSG